MSDNITELAEKVAEFIHLKGGATITRGGVEKTQGIAVAVSKKYEVVMQTPWSQDTIRPWLTQVMPDMLPNPYYCISVWREDNGDVYLDIVDVLPPAQFDRAIKAAIERDQKVIYYLDTHTLLRVI